MTNETDRELLELAAKAAHDNFANQMLDGGWNPLKDDGDALRLAVKLNICIQSDTFNGDTVTLTPREIGDGCGVITEDHGSDPYAATRRAITKASAEIGRTI